MMIIESMHPPNGLFRMKKYFLSFVLSFVLITYGFSLPEGTTAVQGEGNAQTVGSEMTIARIVTITVVRVHAGVVVAVGNGLYPGFEIIQK